MKFSTVSYTDENLEAIDKATDIALEGVSLFASTKMAESMPDAPGVEVGEGGWEYRGGLRSEPGSPPFAQSGELRRAIINGKIGDKQWAAGTRRDYGKTGAPYGFYLDQGTRNMLARPWLGATVKKFRNKMTDIFWRSFEAGLK